MTVYMYFHMYAHLLLEPPYHPAPPAVPPSCVTSTFILDYLKTDNTKNKGMLM